jgi:hypothetical protein
MARKRQDEIDRAAIAIHHPRSPMIRRCDERDFEQMWSIINDGAHAYEGVIPPDCWTEPYMPAKNCALKWTTA